MKAYCINLDRRPDRLTYMTAEFAKAGIPFERIAAVDGQDLQVAAEAAQLPLSFENVRISAGAHGCMQSHRKFWCSVVASGDPWGMVFEDDLLLAPDILGCIQDSWVPADADIVKLETFATRVHLGARSLPVFGNRCVAQLHTTHLGTGCYVVSAAAAARLLRETVACGNPVDHFLFNASLPFFPTARIYQMFPAPVIQGDRALAKLQKNQSPSGWQMSSIDARVANEHEGTHLARPETLLRRLWRRGREEMRARVLSTRYVVVPHA
jgi:glycosyl transferase, family 25